jgi:hypothetical protein
MKNPSGVDRKGMKTTIPNLPEPLIPVPKENKGRNKRAI